MRIPVYAIACTWNEEDIIASTVQHAFTQGCDAVFIVDNGSTDETVARAVNAGATHHTTFITRYFNEDSKIMALNSAISELNAHHRHEQAWWLIIDADEFPSAPGYESLRDFIQKQPPAVRAVESRMINHEPTHHPYFWEGFHPIDFQPWGWLDKVTKYQLLRYEHKKEHIVTLGGAHNYHLDGGKRLTHSKTVLNLHHFPYRVRETALARLAELARIREDGTSRLDWMDRHGGKSGGANESMYRSRLGSLDNRYIKHQNIHHYAPDNEFWDFASILRWYGWNNFYQAVQNRMEELAGLEFTAHHLYIRGQYDQALVCFDRLIRSFGENGQNPATYLYFLGLCFHKTGDCPTARTAFSKALAAGPDLNCLRKIKEAIIACENPLQTDTF
jgi:Glycosyltransferases involved in cell wall biogenesis